MTGSPYVTRDPCSCSNFTEIVLKELSLNWRVDFGLHQIIGSADLHLQVLQDNVSKLLLDSRGLELESFEIVNGEKLKFLEKPSHVPAFGSIVEVSLPGGLKKGSNLIVRGTYKVHESSSALQWLRAEQTGGKEQPYLFSQCQAIHARSLVPCMDTPAVKQSYRAQISVPQPLVALMSAVGGGEPSADLVHTGNRVFHFAQKVPIPSYLIAIVVGKLERRELGPRCAVWAEGGIVDAAAEEFSETEDMLNTAEELLGPYVWGRYDILVLPPSFPFGGMENPCLTFATPTLLAGDKSLANVIAHEISHSWSGNLVTNSTWDHFWLNEGFTTFSERKITGRILAKKYPGSSVEAHRQALAIGGLTSLNEAVTVQFNPQHQHTKLIWDVANDDPDDAFSTVPYEKGHTFLFVLEGIVGGPQNFEKWLRIYFDHFKYQSITTKEWLQHFKEYFTANGYGDALNKVDWDAWFTTPGLPPVIPSYDRSLLEKSEQLAKACINASDSASFPKSGFMELQPIQREEFLSDLLKAAPLPHWKLDTLQKQYNLNQTKNSELLLEWIRLGLQSHWESAIPIALKFVSSQGRMKYTRPVYRDLYAWEAARPKSVECFQANRSSMHNTTAMLVAKDIHVA